MATNGSRTKELMAKFEKHIKQQQQQQMDTEEKKGVKLEKRISSEWEIVNEGVKNGTIADLTPRKPDPWKNFMQLFTGGKGGFCAPNSKVAKVLDYDEQPRTVPLAQSISTEEDSIPCDMSDITTTDRTSGTTDARANEPLHREKDSSSPTWESRPRDYSGVSMITANSKKKTKDDVKIEKTEDAKAEKSTAPLASVKQEEEECEESSTEFNDFKKILFLAFCAIAVFGMKYFYFDCFSPTPSVMTIPPVTMTEQVPDIDTAQDISTSAFQKSKNQPDELVKSENEMKYSDVADDAVEEESVEESIVSITDEPFETQEESLPVVEETVEENVAQKGEIEAKGSAAIESVDSVEETVEDVTIIADQSPLSEKENEEIHDSVIEEKHADIVEEIDVNEIEEDVEDITTTDEELSAIEESVYDDAVEELGEVEKEIVDVLEKSAETEQEEETPVDTVEDSVEDNVLTDEESLVIDEEKESVHDDAVEQPEEETTSDNEETTETEQEEDVKDTCATDEELSVIDKEKEPVLDNTVEEIEETDSVDVVEESAETEQEEATPVDAIVEPVEDVTATDEEPSVIDEENKSVLDNTVEEIEETDSVDVVEESAEIEQEEATPVDAIVENVKDLTFTDEESPVFDGEVYNNAVEDEINTTAINEESAEIEQEEATPVDAVVKDLEDTVVTDEESIHVNVIEEAVEDTDDNDEESPETKQQEADKDIAVTDEESAETKQEEENPADKIINVVNESRDHQPTENANEEKNSTDTMEEEVTAMIEDEISAQTHLPNESQEETDGDIPDETDGDTSDETETPPEPILDRRTRRLQPQHHFKDPLREDEIPSIPRKAFKWEPEKFDKFVIADLESMFETEPQNEFLVVFNEFSRKISRTVKQKIRQIIKALSPTFEKVQTVAKPHLINIKNQLQPVFNDVKAQVEPVFYNVKDQVQPVLKKVLSPAVKKISSSNELDSDSDTTPQKEFIMVLGQVSETIKKRMQPFRKSLGPTCEKAREKLRPILEQLKDLRPILKQLNDRVQPILKKVAPMMKELKVKIESAIHKLVDVWDNALDFISDRMI